MTQKTTTKITLAQLNKVRGVFRAGVHFTQGTPKHLGIVAGVARAVVGKSSGDGVSVTPVVMGHIYGMLGESEWLAPKAILPPKVTTAIEAALKKSPEVAFAFGFDLISDDKGYEVATMEIIKPEPADILTPIIERVKSAITKEEGSK